MSGSAPAVVNEDFDRWSDDTPEVNQKDTKEREFDAWSEDSEVDVVMVDDPLGEEAPEEQEPFFTDTDPDISHLDLGVSSKSSAPHPGEVKDVKENAHSTPLIPRPPKAPPPAHLLRRNVAAELPLPPPPAMPPLGMQQLRPVVHQVPVVLLPVSPTWSCFVALQHGAEHTKLLATLLMGDVATAQALVQDANSRFKLSHRKHFQEVKKSIVGAALKVVLQLVPLSGDAKDHQVRDNLEAYLLSKDRAGVVRVGNRDMYLIPPAKVKDCGLKVVPPAKSLVAAITEKTRSKKAKEKVAKAKKVVEPVEAEAAEAEADDDTEDSEEAKTGKDKKEVKEDEMSKENGAAAVSEETKEEVKEDEVSKENGAAAVSEETKEEVKEDEMSKENGAAAVSEETKEEAKKDEKEKVHHSPFESRSFQVNPEAKPPPAKPRFSRLDVENAAFKIARSRYDQDVPVHREQRPSQMPGPPLPPGTWLPFPPQLPRWNPYVCPPDVPDVPAERRKKRHKSSKEHRTRPRRRAKSKDSESESTPKRSRSRHEEVVRNPYVNLAGEEDGPAEVPPTAQDDDPTDAKWKGLLARVEALAEFCRSDGQDA